MGLVAFWKNIWLAERCHLFTKIVAEDQLSDEMIKLNIEFNLKVFPLI